MDVSSSPAKPNVHTRSRWTRRRQWPTSSRLDAVVLGARPPHSQRRSPMTVSLAPDAPTLPWVLPPAVGSAHPGGQRSAGRCRDRTLPGYVLVATAFKKSSTCEPQALGSTVGRCEVTHQTAVGAPRRVATRSGGDATVPFQLSVRALGAVVDDEPAKFCRRECEKSLDEGHVAVHAEADLDRDAVVVR